MTSPECEFNLSGLFVASRLCARRPGATDDQHHQENEERNSRCGRDEEKVFAQTRKEGRNNFEKEVYKQSGTAKDVRRREVTLRVF